MNLTDIIKKPLVTEKSHSLITGKNQYPLRVDKSATKGAVKKAVEKLFGVSVLKIRTINYPGKTRRSGKQRKQFAIPGFKKAIVTLKAGEKIPLFEFEGDKK